MAEAVHEEWKQRVQHAVDSFAGGKWRRRDLGPLGQHILASCFGAVTLGTVALATKVLVLRHLNKHQKPILAAHRLGGEAAVEALLLQLLDSAIENDKVDMRCDGEQFPAWVIPPFAVGHAHTTRFGQHIYDYEVGVAPLLFGRAKIFKGPVGRRQLDKAWEYPTPEEAIIALVAWQVAGFEGEPEGAMRITGELHDNERPLCKRCMNEVEKETSDEG